MADKRDEIRDRANDERNRLLVQIDRLTTRGPKHLGTEQRLRAAQYIRARYKALVRPNGQWLGKDIEERLSEIGDQLIGLRIHRWMLGENDGDVTPELIEHYKSKVEPQKKTRTYFALASALAKIGNNDPVEAQIDLLRAIGLDDHDFHKPLSAVDGPFDPAKGLLLLLRDFASHTAERLDLARLFERTERLQAGWNPILGLQASTLDDPFQAYSASSIISGSWLMTGVPALPCAAVADIPLGKFAGAEFELTSSDADRQTVQGDAVSWWRLYFGIAPRSGGGVAPCLIRTVRLTVTLHSPDAHEGDEYEIVHSGDGLQDLHPGSGRRPTFLAFPERVISLTESSAELFDSLDTGDRLYLRTTHKEILPHESIPCAEIENLDVGRLLLWLRDSGGRDYESLKLLLPTTTPSGEARWYTSPCLARDLEQCLRSGTLQGEIAKWVRAYSRSLDALELERRSQMVNADDALKDQWATERLLSEGSDSISLSKTEERDQ